MSNRVKICIFFLKHNLQCHFVTASLYFPATQPLKSAKNIIHIWLSESALLPEYQTREKPSPMLGLQIQTRKQKNFSNFSCYSNSDKEQKKFQGEVCCKMFRWASIGRKKKAKEDLANLKELLKLPSELWAYNVSCIYHDKTNLNWTWCLLVCVCVCTCVCVCVLTNYRGKHNHAMTLRQTASLSVNPLLPWKVNNRVNFLITAISYSL